MVLEPEWNAIFEPTSMVFALKEGNMMLLDEFIIIFKVENGVGYMKENLNHVFDTLSHDFILKQIKGFPQYNLVKRFFRSKIC